MSKPASATNADPAAPATRAVLAALWKGEDERPDRAAMTAVADEFMEGAVPQPLMAALLAAVRFAGVTADDLAAFAGAMRARATPVTPRADLPTIDLCGTGGDGYHTINVSTMAAIVVAAEGGVAVAKHGNRAVSSTCGSADILEELGVPIDVQASVAQRHLDQLGICFMFAPKHHAAMRHVMPVRRELGLPTLFNLLGPLSNPAGVDRQLIGVGVEAAFEHYPEALRMLGAKRALVVRGEWGMDELTPFGCNLLRELDEEGRIIDSELTAEMLGLEPMNPDELRAPDTREANAALFRSILSGKDKTTRRAAVALNAGAALYLADRAPTIRDGMTLAESVIDDGRAIALLNKWAGD